VESSGSLVTWLYDTFLRLAISGLGGVNASNSPMGAGICLYPVTPRNCSCATRSLDPTQRWRWSPPHRRFTFLATLLHNGERRLDHIGAGEGLSELRRDVQPMHGQHVERQLGTGMVVNSAGRAELLRGLRFLFVCQTIQYVAAPVDLAAPDRPRSVPWHSPECRAAVP